MKRNFKLEKHLRIPLRGASFYILRHQECCYQTNSKAGNYFRYRIATSNGTIYASYASFFKGGRGAAILLQVHCSIISISTVRRAGVLSHTKDFKIVMFLITKITSAPLLSLAQFLGL